MNIKEKEVAKCEIRIKKRNNNWLINDEKKKEVNIHYQSRAIYERNKYIEQSE